MVSPVCLWVREKKVLQKVFSITENLGIVELKSDCWCEGLQREEKNGELIPSRFFFLYHHSLLVVYFDPKRSSEESDCFARVE